MSNLETFTPTPGQQTIQLRLIQQGDAALLVDLFHHMSPETKRLRFQMYSLNIPEDRIWQEALALSNLDPQRQVAVVATIIEPDGEEHAVGVARFARATVDEVEAEVAIVVRDDFQRKGVGKRLLRLLADKACKLNIVYFTGWVMTENVRLMKLIKGLELKNVESETRLGQTKIRVPLISQKE